MLDTKLIEKALALTGKKYGEMEELKGEVTHCETYQFSIEKFCYYLLSPEFIVKYLIECMPQNWCYSKGGLYSDKIQAEWEETEKSWGDYDLYAELAKLKNNPIDATVVRVDSLLPNNSIVGKIQGSRY